MAVPLEKFVKQLEDSGILAGETLRQFIPPSADPKDAEELVRELVRKKKLTKFQAEEAYKGKAKSLVLGNYVLMEKIGAGGMGQVFKAEHRRMHRIVAVKVLPASTMKDPDTVARFEREVTAAAKLRHPNIVAADDADCANGVHFLVMEMVDGSDLSVLVKKDGPFPVDRAVNCILQAAKGLEFAHNVGVVHRDIKPANLLLDKKGTVKVLDMGLARLSGNEDAPTQAELTGTGAVMGTVDYMAPEQALSTRTADARADIYALGCSLYYLLTGKATYAGETLMAKLLAHRDHPIPDLQVDCPHVPESLGRVFRKMVAKKVADRYQTMTEVIAGLEGCGDGLSNTHTLQSTDSGQMSTREDKQSQSNTVILPASTAGAAKSNRSIAPKLTASSTDASDLDFPEDFPSAPPRSLRTKKTTRQRSPKGKNALLKDNNRLLLIGAAVFGVLILLAGLTVTLKTRAGKLVLTVNEPDAEVQVLSEEGKVEVEIRRKGENGPITVSIVPGKHQLNIHKDGFELFTDNFEIKSGSTVAITAKLVPRVDKAATATADVATTKPSANPPIENWKPLFDGKSIADWTGDVALMSVEDGILVNDGKRGVVTAPGEFQNFEIEVEFRLANGGNSGLGINSSGVGAPSKTGLEIQMLDDEDFAGITDDRKCGSIFTLANAKTGHFKRWPEWNQFHVTSSGDDVRVELNGVLVTAASRTELKRSNPKHEGILRTSGKVCLFPISSRSEYRNFRIRSTP